MRNNHTSAQERPNPVDRFNSDIERLPSYNRALIHSRHLPPRAIRCGQLDAPLPDPIRERLAENGIDSLYVHQARAINLMRSGRNVVIATNTASGKSVCYQTPTIDRLLSNPRATACYMFPTKALAQDQLKSISRLMPPESDIHTATFDADTPKPERQGIKNSARVIITNPDMLSRSTLPWHRGWAKFLSGLSVIVIDESHTYRGIFGSHIAMIIRRLRRLCAHYGSNPVFALSSASIANPVEHAQSLTGLPFELVDDDGSPSGPKRFIFWRTMGDNGRPVMSVDEEAADISADLIARGIRVMTFSRTTHGTENIYNLAKNYLSRGALDLSGAIEPYKGGYMPEHRRKVETALKNDELSGIITTNAMELGVDIGHLGATVMAGYPGTAASTWQRAGRAGRNGKPSVSIIICSDHPIDQHVLRNPETLFDRPTEHARVSLDNPVIARDHILAAAAELPLTRSDFDLFGEDLLRETTVHLMSRNLLVFNSRSRSRTTAPGVDNPSYDINIRSVPGEAYSIIDSASGEIIERIQEETAFRDIYPGAVYMSRGQARLIKKVDHDARTATTTRQRASYTTSADIATKLTVRKILDSRPLLGRRATVNLGLITVTQRRIGYSRNSPRDGSPLKYHKFRSPREKILETTGMWVSGIKNATGNNPFAGEEDALHAIEHAGRNALTIMSMSEPADIRGLIAPASPKEYDSIFLFDVHAGGSGIAQFGYASAEAMFATTLSIIEDCTCDSGCQVCVETYMCESGIHPNARRGAALLRFILTGSVRRPNSHEAAPDAAYTQGRFDGS